MHLKIVDPIPSNLVWGPHWSVNPFWHAYLTSFDFDIRLSSLLSIAEQLFDQIHERVIEPHDAGAEQETEVAAKIGQEVGKVVGVVLGDNSIDLKNRPNIAQSQGLQNPFGGPNIGTGYRFDTKDKDLI